MCRKWFLCDLLKLTLKLTCYFEFHSCILIWNFIYEYQHDSVQDIQDILIFCHRNPTVTGTSVLGVKFEGGVAIAADMLGKNCLNYSIFRGQLGWHDKESFLIINSSWFLKSQIAWLWG